MFSIKTTTEALELTVLGIKLKFTKGLRVEHERGGPYGLYDLVKAHAGVEFCTKDILIQHGWSPLDSVCLGDLQDAKALMLSWNGKLNAEWAQKSSVPCLNIGAPFVHHRRARNIRVAKDAKGTIAFPAHAVPQVRPEFDLDKYCDGLKALPPQYQPVTVCLHFADIDYYNMDKEYEARGLKTVCAGSGKHRPFYEAFYELLSRHRYATSNEPGSYLFYAVEMGIPFFLHGDKAIRDNSEGAIKVLPADVRAISDYALGKAAQDLFQGGPVDVISPEQRDFVLSELGMDDCASVREAREAIVRAIVAEHYKAPFPRFAWSVAKKIARHPLDAREIVRFYRFVRAGAKEFGVRDGR